MKGFNELIHRVKSLEDIKAVSETVTTRLEADNIGLNIVVNDLELRIDDQEQLLRAR